MPTPLVYHGLVYVLANQGILDCYELRSGKETYRKRIPHQGSGFSASPVAADGRVYPSGEDGDIFAVGCGANFELLAANPMGERLMPAEKSSCVRSLAAPTGYTLLRVLGS